MRNTLRIWQKFALRLKGLRLTQKRNSLTKKKPSATERKFAFKTVIEFQKLRRIDYQVS